MNALLRCLALALVLSSCTSGPTPRTAPQIAKAKASAPAADFSGGPSPTFSAAAERLPGLTNRVRGPNSNAWVKADTFFPPPYLEGLRVTASPKDVLFTVLLSGPTNVVLETSSDFTNWQALPVAYFGPTNGIVFHVGGNDGSPARFYRLRPR